ncbi:MAG: hypothetical protein Q4F27_03605, partial [Desulfovibrionaceae bacterium]|nr:hypothetical protein [Desulfovibrionaceae bacterium]
MEILGINPSLNFGYALPDKEGSSPAAATQNLQDTVEISSPYVLPDDEVDSVMDETLSMIAQDNVAALSVHGGL